MGALIYFRIDDNNNEKSIFDLLYEFPTVDLELGPIFFFIGNQWIKDKRKPGAMN